MHREAWDQGDRVTVKKRLNSSLSLNEPPSHLDLVSRSGKTGMDGIVWCLCRSFLSLLMGGIPSGCWPVPVLVRARPSYRAAHWPAVFPAVGQCVEGSRTLMSPWCAEGKVQTAANLNFCGCSRLHVAWHSDTGPQGEEWGGGSGDPTLIVSFIPGSTAAFKWKAKSCSDSDAGSCWLHHGDHLVVVVRCQDEYLHCTSPGLAD